jgi:hypothetical protein
MTKRTKSTSILPQKSILHAIPRSFPLRNELATTLESLVANFFSTEVGITGKYGTRYAQHSFLDLALERT